MRINPSLAFLALSLVGCGNNQTPPPENPKPAALQTTPAKSEGSITFQIQEAARKSAERELLELENFSMAYYLNEQLSKNNKTKIDIIAVDEKEKTRIDDALNVLERLYPDDLNDLKSRINVVGSTAEAGSKNKTYPLPYLLERGTGLLTEHPEFAPRNRVIRNKMENQKVHPLFKPAG